MKMDPSLRAELNEMWQRIIELEKRPVSTVKPAPADECKKGKYVGQKLIDIVKRDPQYVCWLEENKYATGIGFTAEHYEQAKMLMAAREEEEREESPPWD